MDEISRSLAVDWWSSERVRIEGELEERLPLLLLKVDEAIDAMTPRDFVKRSAFTTAKIEPIATDWIEKEYRRLSAEIDASFSASILAVDGTAGSQVWTHADYLTAGVAAAFSVAPLAALPFVGGMVVVGGTLFAPAATIAVVPAAIVGAGAVALGYGPSMRGWAVNRIRSAYRQTVHAGLRSRVLGDAAHPEMGSLKGTLFTELDGMLEKRLEALA